MAQRSTGTRNPVSLVDPVDGRALPLRIAYPLHGTSVPIVLFSHGLYSSMDEYNPILDRYVRAFERADVRARSKRRLWTSGSSKLGLRTRKRVSPVRL